jgi:cob(I)alamin adenosyltransferase
MDQKQIQKGYVQLYTGDGKGKTTAALGLALRAAGHGLRSYIGQFMKGTFYGELEALKNYPLIQLDQFGGEHCIRREDVTGEDIAQAQHGLERTREEMLSGNFDIVILDEVNIAIWFGLLSTEEVVTLVEKRPDHVELVLTGRRAPEALIQIADLVTEMREVKHYFQRGVTAREGIEH